MASHRGPWFDAALPVHRLAPAFRFLVFFLSGILDFHCSAACTIDPCSDLLPRMDDLPTSRPTTSLPPPPPPHDTDTSSRVSADWPLS